MYYIYIVRCRGGSLYTGIAADIRRRLQQHLSRSTACAKYTRAHPVEALEALWQTEDHAAAARLEALIKTLPRQQKLALIAQLQTPYEIFGERLQGCSYQPVVPVSLDRILHPQACAPSSADAAAFVYTISE